MRYLFSHISIVVVLSIFNPLVIKNVLANELIIDDRTSGNLNSNQGFEWRLFSDQVMGGVSRGSLTIENNRGRNCLCMTGEVSLDNNGGFVQIALPLSQPGPFDASAYNGIELEVAGNNEIYNVHLRTASLEYPWQSYRASFNAAENWQKIRIAFDSLEPYRTPLPFEKHRLLRIGLVAIGREFDADVCLASLRLYVE